MKSLIAVFLMVATVYVSLCTWMFVRQRDLIYFPHFTRTVASQSDFAIVHEGHTLRGWVANPGRGDAVIYFGGNAESLEPMRDALAGWLPDHTTYLVAYRGFGASDGVPEEQALARDATAIFDDVQARHPMGSVSVIGRSLGTGVASHLASRRAVSRLVLITPFDSLVDVARSHYPWLPVRWLMRERYESARHLSVYRGPILILRAGRDQVVPPARTDRLIAALPRPPKVLNLPAADHIDVVDHPQFRAALKRFLE